MDWMSVEGEPPSKQQLLRAALQLFVRDGVWETSIRAIAVLAGYTNPALYKFFGSREALALEVFERCYQHVYDTLQASQHPEHTFDTNLSSLLDAYVQLLEQSREAVLFVNDTLRDMWPKVRRATRKHSLLALLGDLVRQGKKEHVVAATLHEGLAVSLITGTLAQVARIVHFGELKLNRPERQALQQMFHAALTPRTA